MKMNNAGIIDLARGNGHEKWIGCYGYDTRSYIEDGSALRYLPVAYATGFAENGMEGYTTEEEDLVGFITGLPIGTVIVFPEFLGCTRLWDYDQHWQKGGDDAWFNVTPKEEDD